MRVRLTALLAASILVTLSAGAFMQEKGGDDRTGPYDVVTGWPQPLTFAKPGYIWGSTGGIFAETPNRIFIANRGELKLPSTLAPAFTGFWGSFGEQATTPTPEFRNCLVVVDHEGKAIESWTQPRTVDDVLKALGDARVPAGRVYTARDICEDPHYRARDMIQRFNLPNGQPIDMPGIVPKLSATPGQTNWVGPELGQHTAEVLASIGRSPEQIEALRQMGVI